MNGYAGLPTLVLNQIFGYLSVKERIKAKSVCLAWKEEIELREQMNDTLVLHLGPYPWNLHWTETNNRGLMKFENSFEMKHSTILEHPLTRSLLEKIKKLAIVDMFTTLVPGMSSIHPYINCFKQCEELEIRRMPIEDAPAFHLPKLKVLVIRDCMVTKLVLNCPALEVLYSNWKADEVYFQSVKKLKRLICFGWPVKIAADQKFECLEDLDLFAEGDQRVNDRLLDRMPKLKRFVLYSSDPQADLEIIRRQQRRFGLDNLEVLFSGFREPVEIELGHQVTGIIRLDLCVDQLFENYSKLVGNSPWKTSIDYSKLFNKFKILPSNFFERFRELYSVEVSAVTNYTHLFAFLKYCPFIQQLKLHWSKVKAQQILDMVFLLQRSPRELAIVEERSSDLLVIDLSFMSIFSMLACLYLYSTHIPIKFLREVATRRGPHFNSLYFVDTTNDHQMIFHFGSAGIVLHHLSSGSSTSAFSSIEQLIAFVQSDPHVSDFFM